MLALTLSAFADELTKIAVKVPFLHGTSGRWDVLSPGVGSTILRNDPNARAVYTAMKSRSKMPGIATFAEDAAKRRGGEAVIAQGKMDTRKGWAPFNLTPWGKKNIGTPEDARGLIEELESAEGPRRGEIWRTLHQGVGSWRNDDLSASLKPTKYTSVVPSEVRKAG